MDGAKEYRTGDSVKLQIKTDPQALVALGAVDTALYAVGGKTHKPLDMGKVCHALSISCEPKLHSTRCHQPLSGLPWSLEPSPFLSYPWSPVLTPQGSSFFKPCPNTLSRVAGRAPQPLLCPSISSLPCQVFEVMNSYNLGCGPGGGDNALEVFQAAGLAFSDGDQLSQVREGKNGARGARQGRKDWGGVGMEQGI